MRRERTWSSEQWINTLKPGESSIYKVTVLNSRPTAADFLQKVFGGWWRGGGDGGVTSARFGRKCQSNKCRRLLLHDQRIEEKLLFEETLRFSGFVSQAKVAAEFRKSVEGGRAGAPFYYPKKWKKRYLLEETLSKS